MQIPTLDEINLALARKSLLEFTKYTMPEYRSNWHHELMCEYLDKFVKLEIKRLMIFMPPRHGKCLAGGQRVQMIDGKLTAIEDLRRSDMVISLDSCYNTTGKAVIATAQNGVKPVIKITLQSGRYIVCTENHPLMTIDGWTEAGTLAIGDSIAALREVPVPDGEPLPHGFAALMGYITGDGSYGKGDAILTASEPEVVAHLAKIADYHSWKLAPQGKFGYHIRNKVRTGSHNGTSAKERLREYMVPAKSINKRVPPCIFQSGRDDLCDFIAAYFNADATVTDLRSGIAEFYSTSEGLLRDVQHLLTRLGIYSRLRIKRGRYKGEEHYSWRLIIEGVDLVTLADSIPAVGVRGDKLRRVADRVRRQAHYPEYDAVPTGWQKYTNKTTGWHRRNRGIRVDKKYKHGTARRLVLDVADFEDNQKLRDLCASNLIWERIVSIEALPPEPTYDIEVDETHNFIVDNIVTHNSQLVSRHLPAYILGQNPNAPIIAASYGADLARRMNRDVQRIIDSPEYGRIFPKTRLFGKNIRTVAGGSWLRNSDEFEVVEYNGYYRGAGVGGAMTGMGSLYSIIDDPVKNRQDASSATIRQSLWDWYVSTFRTRLAPGGGILITVTRWHEDGLEARLLRLAESSPDAEQWTVISLPAIAEEPLAPYDIRQPGQALWESQYGLNELNATKVTLGSYEWNALYQQRPSPDSGGIFKRHWWRYWKPKGVTLPPVSVKLEDGGLAEIEAIDLPNDLDETIQSWDMAFKGTDTSDYVAGQVWARVGVSKYMLDYFKERADIGESIRAVIRLAEKWPNTYAKLVEDKANGPAIIDLLRGKVDGLIPVEPEGGKVSRAHAASPSVESGNVYLPHPALFGWVNEFVTSCAAFPNGTHDDDVDAFTQAMARWTSRPSAEKMIDFV